MLHSIKKELAKAIADATNSDSEIIFPLIEKPKNESQGHLAFPCFHFAKIEKTTPVDCALKIKEKITLPTSIEEVVQIGPFLNFNLNLKQICTSLITNPLPTKTTKAEQETILVEYSSPNIAKPFHVGHLRATLIGNCLDRLYRFNGYKVESINHLGDWGTQFGYVFAGCKIWGDPETFAVSSLVDLYKKATAKKDEEEKDGTANEPHSVTSIARNYFLRLEAQEEEALKFWKRCVDVSLIYLEHTYARLNIKFDHYLGESFYSDKLEGIKDDLIKANILEESQGALGVNLGEELGFARILTPDGRSLYLTRDIAAAEYRFNRFNYIKSIYVVGAPQTLHFKQLSEVLKRANKKFHDRLIHVAFGHVLGMKTRGDGQAIELNTFLDEAKERALKAYNLEVQKRPENVDEEIVSTNVALAAVIFSTLNRTNIKDVHFSWDDALSFQGDSGPYLLYAYARLCGVERNASKAEIKHTNNINYDAIDTDSGKNLLIKLLEFESALLGAERVNEPLILCNYALELSKCISRAYIDLKVIGEAKEVAESRFSLFMAARTTLGTALKLLGINPIEQM